MNLQLFPLKLSSWALWKPSNTLVFAFGRLTKRLWTNRNIRLDTKIAVYRAAVITSLLFGCETWTLKKAHFARLEKFHQTTLRRIARIRWFHKVPNYEVLSHCNIPTLQSMIESAQLRWCGHVVRMKDDRIPKALLYGRLADGTSSRGNHKTYLNTLKSTLGACVIRCDQLETLASQRNLQRWHCKGGEKTYRAPRNKENETQGKDGSCSSDDLTSAHKGPRQWIYWWDGCVKPKPSSPSYLSVIQ